MLILCIGKQTKDISRYQGLVKEYIGTFTLGATTPSYDLETEVDEIFPVDHITRKLLEQSIQQFLGEIDQKPLFLSAIKKDGKRLYEIARRGKTTEISSRKITIYEFEITEVSLPHVTFRRVCSKGTYIRSLRSLGHSCTLHDFEVEKTQSIEQFIENLGVA